MVDDITNGSQVTNGSGEEGYPDREAQAELAREKLDKDVFGVLSNYPDAGFFGSIGKWLYACTVGLVVYAFGRVGITFDEFTGRFNDTTHEYINAQIDKMRTEGVFSTQFAAEFKEETNDVWPPFLIPYAVALTLMSGMGALLSFFQGFQNLRAQAVNEDLRPNMIDIQSLVAAYFRLPDRREEIAKLLDLWGVPDEQQEMLLSTSVSLPGIQEILTLVNREFLTVTEGDELLRLQGFPDEMASHIMELRKFYPGPQDLVMLAGREAFEEDAISRFQLDTDMPPELEAVAAKAGITPEILRWYWIAHWQNPSINQVFEMIHRRVQKPDAAGRPGLGGTFDTDDLDVYYRLADVNPFFGDLLRQIAYQPLTRVDVRRMRQLGVLDEEQVVNAYKDLGYDETNAEAMADFTERYNNRGTRELTRSQIEDLFHQGQITRIQLERWLIAIGYDQDEAAAISYLERTKRDAKRNKAEVDAVEYLYKRGQQDDLIAARQLGVIGLETEAIAELLGDWRAQKLVEQALPSKTDLLDWFQAGIIAEEKFRTGMEMLRYDEDAISLYIQSGEALLSKTDLLRLYDRGQIDRLRAEDGLKALGYSTGDITALLTEVEERIRRREEYEQV